MADLAERVGLRKASLFHHFASKEQLRTRGPRAARAARDRRPRGGDGRSGRRGRLRANASTPSRMPSSPTSSASSPTPLGSSCARRWNGARTRGHARRRRSPESLTRRREVHPAGQQAGVFPAGATRSRSSPRSWGCTCLPFALGGVDGALHGPRAVERRVRRRASRGGARPGSRAARSKIAARARACRCRRTS